MCLINCYQSHLSSIWIGVFGHLMLFRAGVKSIMRGPKSQGAGLGREGDDRGGFLGGGVDRGVEREQTMGFKAAEEKVQVIKRRNGDSGRERSQMSQFGKIPNFPKKF